MRLSFLLARNNNDVFRFSLKQKHLVIVLIIVERTVGKKVPMKTFYFFAQFR